MATLFFEGFNNQNTTSRKLDENYWSTPTLSKIEMGSGRTGNQVYLLNRPAASGLTDSTALTLYNFTDPLINDTSFAIGFYTDYYAIRTNNNNAPPPYAEKFLEFYNSGVSVLRIDIIKTTYQSTNSLGLGIYQNDSLVDTYDFKSFTGHTWTTYFENNAAMIQQQSYIEVYIDPKNNNEIAIRFSANNTNNAFLRNTTNNIYTTISGFNNLTSIKFYGNNDILYGETSYRRTIDDLYLCGGNSPSECLLGNNTKIYRLNLNSNTPTQEWFGQYAGGISQSDYWYVSSDDGDTSYIFSSTRGNQSIFNLSDIPNDAPSNISGIKIINIARKSSIQGANFNNVFTSGNDTSPIDIGGAGSGFYINSDQYSTKSEFLFTNPFTGSGWTKQEINDLQVGVKYLGWYPKLWTIGV